MHVCVCVAGVGIPGLSSGVLGLEEVMQQQVALVRQFLDSQQLMHQAYTSTLVSSHRYTSLRRTEKVCGFTLLYLPTYSTQ